jgi:hypothetical protein
MIKVSLAHTDNSVTATLVQQWSKFSIDFSNKFLGDVPKLNECIKRINEQKLILTESIRAINKLHDIIAIQKGVMLKKIFDELTAQKDLISSSLSQFSREFQLFLNILKD